MDEALEERERELAVLRQDVAALWLAFAQHDRVLRTLIDREGTAASPPETAPGTPAASPGADAAPPAATPAPPRAPAADAASIGEQLSELDEVLAAIEMATQTLEQTYAEEIRAAGERDDRPEATTPEQPPPED
ncbi:MAG: hypothetical protein R2718_01325 [Solirubrobacterales bacterium]